MDNDLDRFAHPTYLIRKQFFKLFGERFHIYGPGDELMLYTKMKAFKLKEDIRLYEGEAMQRELLVIRARSVIDWGATYDVVDPVSQEKIGSLRRKALKSLIRDEWVVFDGNDREIGAIVEDSTIQAIVRRFVDFASLLMPQAFHVEIGGQTVATFKQRINPFIQKIDLDFTADTRGAFDRRLGLAAAVLMAAIEGRQS